ncbi:hypothetical protein K450DRAFT_198686 [Umbelopsis ramanniana AG]|uniref:Uncharacterized protein n=1 Tax=Umbelopsis ramanniana AG TaxID=1314678 RepID=A0AAD5EBE8_UMBRA|nr:uncharacterized protein K450DRAFT_198686 [Umbelopsis ramanniana AG]KAI8580297.1 hypothetical protein K450DRAFT_198686 [Umbelopsis ramanniana AG]
MHASRYDALRHSKKGAHKGKGKPPRINARSQDECKSASDIDDVETASTVTGISLSNASRFSSFDMKPKYFLDLVQSSQEVLSDTVNDCYGTLGGIQQQTVENLKSLSDSTDDSDCNDKRIGTITPIGVYRSLADTTSYRRLSSSEQPLLEQISPLLKIPWDVSVSQVTQFFKSIKFPPPQMHSHFVHYPVKPEQIIIDRSTGKTVSNAFVEVLEPSEAQRAVTTCHRKPLKGRLVHVSLSDQDELLKSLFPCWAGNFVKGMAIPVEAQSVSPKQGQTFITRQEINSILTICRNYKIHFSRKCPERPFENIMSIVCKYPWYQPELVTALQRDHIYECLKLAIGKYMVLPECLCSHIAKDYITIDPALVVRMVRTGVMCPTFTERQQNVILNSAGQECPEDIKHFIVPDHDKNTDSSSEGTFTEYAPTESDDEDSDLSIGSSKLSKKDSSSHKLLAPHTHKHDEAGGDDTTSDLNAWYDALPTSILDILDNASNMRHVGMKEFHSSFSTRVEVQQPKGKVTSQLESIPVRKLPSESTSLKIETQPDSRSAIEERIRLLCEQLQPLCKRKGNIM